MLTKASITSSLSVIVLGCALANLELCNKDAAGQKNPKKPQQNTRTSRRNGDKSERVQVGPPRRALETVVIIRCYALL